jgi:hypothetical protein
MGLYDRVDSKRKQKKVDTGQNDKIVSLEKQLKEIEEKSQKRGNSKRDREDELRDSLERSGPLIRREYERDFARLGDRFAQGDCEFRPYVPSHCARWRNVPAQDSLPCPACRDLIVFVLPFVHTRVARVWY